MANRMDIYDIQENPKTKKKFWARIGTAWQNQDGSYNLKFSLLPVTWDNVQMREPRERETKGESFEE
jgi:hypothetical protein